MSGGSYSRVNNETLKYIKESNEQREREAQLAAQAAADAVDAADAADAVDALDASNALDAASSQHDMQQDEQDDTQDDMQLDHSMLEMQSDDEGEVPPFENPIDALDVEEQPAEGDIAKSVINIDDQELDDDYSKLAVGAVVNTKIYDKNSPLRDAKLEHECFGVLEQAFAPGFVGDLSDLIRKIIHDFNFELCEVTRLRNKAQHDMHAQYKKSYKVKQSVTAFHGTEHGEKISRIGFRGSAGKRAKFGRGIYTSKDVCHAMAYSKLTKEDTLTFLVVDKHLGPTAIGREDQVFPPSLHSYHSFLSSCVIH